MAGWSAAGIGAACGLIPPALAASAAWSSWLADARLAAGAAFSCLGVAGGIWLALRLEQPGKAPLFGAAGLLPPAVLAAISLLLAPPDGIRRLTADLVLYPAVSGIALSLCAGDPRPWRLPRCIWRGLFLAAAAVGISLPPALLLGIALRAARTLVEWAVMPAAFGLGNAVFLLSLWRHHRRAESRAAITRLLDKLRGARKGGAQPREHVT
ncbi:MAG: hypothetical protein N3A38_06955 [Planctomycetota bacterium]|nr:hypothetical protein [Planctomycetota bacterium]